MNKKQGVLPVPRSSWEIGPSGGVGAEGEAKRGRPLIGRQRAESTCSACGGIGHNSRNKMCPKRKP